MNSVRVALRLFQSAAPTTLSLGSVTSLQQQATRSSAGLLATALSGPQAHNFTTGLDSRFSLPSQVASRKNMFADILMVSELLPNRKAIAAQFSPHGITLVPKSILAGSFGPTGATQAPSEMEDDEQQETQDDGAIQAIGIKQWRRLKMKKHKISKRRKLNRHKNKP